MPLQKARLKISDYNQQRKASLRKKERRLQMVSLSLTSMVDMFAILVIFLLTNTSTVSTWFEIGKGIELPKAKYSQDPIKGSTIQISDNGIYGDNTLLLTQEAFQAGPSAIQTLTSWLSSQPDHKIVNVVGHHKIPYGSVKRIMLACQEAGFQNINLAVQPINH